MERAERQRLRDYLDEYERGLGGDGIKIPEIVVSAAKEALALAASDIPSCDVCGEEAEWHHRDDIYFCDQHPEEHDLGETWDTVGVWRHRYYSLLSRCEAATVHTTIQDMRATLVIALSKDRI